MTRPDGDGTSTCIYKADGSGGYEDRISVVTDIDEIFNDERKNVYVRKDGEYYRMFADKTEKLLVSESVYKDRVLILDYYDNSTGYIIIAPDENNSGGGLY